MFDSVNGTVVNAVRHAHSRKHYANLVNASAVLVSRPKLVYIDLYLQAVLQSSCYLQHSRTQWLKASTPS
jgi:hypothetical protein